MKKLLIYYNFIIISIIVATGFLNSRTVAQLVSAIFFFPLAAYFGFLIWPRKNKAIIFPKRKLTLETLPDKSIASQDLSQTRTSSVRGKPQTRISSVRGKPQTGELVKLEQTVFDFDRRKFLKLIGSAGISVFVLSLFTKRVEAAFFGGGAGPGIVTIKDTDGSHINPAERQPTDGYKITAVDDSGLTSYYGFVNKDGFWFIMKEDANGNYRYARGPASFSASWLIKGELTYDYFNEIF